MQIPPEASRKSSHQVLPSQQPNSAAKMTFSSVLKRIEVKPTDDEYETIETSRWGNRDIYPIAHDKRTYGVYAYVSYWGMYQHSFQSETTF